jgi:hypothetical protein
MSSNLTICEKCSNKLYNKNDSDDDDDNSSVSTNMSADTFNDDFMTQNDADDLFHTSMELIDEYMDNHPECIVNPNFTDTIITELVTLFIDQMKLQQENFEPANESVEIDKSDHDEVLNISIMNQYNLNKKYERVEEVVRASIDHYFEFIVPPRSRNNTYTTQEHHSDQHKTNIHEKLSKVIESDKTQPAQGTNEWYAVRNGMITASNAYKSFDTPASKNQLILEKCVAYAERISGESSKFDRGGERVNTLEWGIRYEPVSIALYEHMYNTKIDPFGCIPHPEYSYIGASPDGINTASENPRFGRMLEIKNVISRIINGIPKKEYWVQMQLQMEVCDLNECDFLETKFTEYGSYGLFLADGSFTTTANDEKKGIIMQFVSNTGKIKYVYKPINEIDTEAEFETWKSDMIDSEAINKYDWVRNCYWKLETLSCVLVERNKNWFENCNHHFKNVWDIIEHERVNGFEHRRGKKMTRTPIETAFGWTGSTVVFKNDFDES